MDRDSVKEYINRQEPTFLKAAKIKGYICPVCGQGSTKGNGITRASGRAGLWHCVNCNPHEHSVLGLYALHAGIPDDTAHFPQILEAAAEYYGIRIDNARGEGAKPMYQNQPKNEQHTHSSIHTNTDTQQDFTPLYREAAKHLQETDYHIKRGLSPEICARYNVGYLPAWKHPNAPKAPASPRLIIPVSPYSYIARDTRSELTKEQEQYKKSKAKARELVSWTFNREALQTAEKPIFVEEGEIDALSIMEAGGVAIAFGSATYIKRFVEELKESRPTQPLILDGDNDKDGKEAIDNLQAELDALAIPYYRYSTTGSYKDANERLIADRQGLIESIAQGEALAMQEAAEKIEERRQDYLKNSAAAHLQDFINGIAASADTPAISTGFSNLDTALDGGLYEGLYICGAISSLGKTTLITQVADQIAQGGHDVLIFSLEMARTEIMSKSISRHTMQEILSTGGDTRNAKTSRGITDGARWKSYSRAERDLIQAAITKYSEYAGHIFITEGVGEIGVAQIRDKVQEHISITGNTPVVVIDYLQILSPYNDRATDKQNTDKAVLELKRISRDYKTPVIAISSFNRENYKNAVTMEAFKESGAIEYSSDVLIGLQLKGAGKDGFDATEEKRKDRRQVELVILKNRNGRTGDKLSFDYYPLFNLFQEG